MTRLAAPRSFSFAGGIPGSKSLYIRALIAASYGSGLEIRGTSDSEDIENVRPGLSALASGVEVDCGEGGAVLQLLALRASRTPGEHLLTGTDRLFSRPMSELTAVLESLGATAAVSGSRLVVGSGGWRADKVVVDCSRSSQFATGVLINSWGLDGPLAIELAGSALSAGYWEMTKRVVGDLGMGVADAGSGVIVAADQVVRGGSYEVELDMGSAFAVAAVAAVSGSARIDDWPQVSSQPDARFPDLLARMGVPLLFDGGALSVGKAPRLSGIEVDLGDSPDLFPVLAALAGLADGPSVLGGAPQLRFKESDRIAKTAELLTGMGRTVHSRSDGIEISGALAPREFAFDADQDHRMAMAAAVVKQAGVPVAISGADSVAKSFGSFWDIVGWRP